MSEFPQERSLSLLVVVLWVAFALALAVSGLVILRACGTLWPFANFCAVQASASGDLAAKNQALLNERQFWVERLGQAEQCRPAQQRAMLDCQPAPTDETLVLVDVSGSMGWDYNPPPDLRAQIAGLEDELVDATGFLRRTALETALNGLTPRVETPARPDRLDVARQALLPLVGGLQGNAKLKMMSFAQCNARVRQEGVFGAGDAAAWANRLNRLQLRNSTALARAIDELPAQTDAGRSPDRPVNIVILSDGMDNCGGDPCAAAARLHRQLPHAHVSVISLAYGRRVNACITEVTGGRFLTPTDSDELMLRLRQTTGQLDAQECVALQTQQQVE